MQGAKDAKYFPNRQPGSADDQDIITDENAPNLRHEQQPIHDATPQENQATLPEHATVEKRRKPPENIVLQCVSTKSFAIMYEEENSGEEV